MKASHLITAILGQHIGLEESGLDCKDGIKRITGAIQVIAALYLAATSDHGVELGHLVGAETHWKAQFA